MQLQPHTTQTRPNHGKPLDMHTRTSTTLSHNTQPRIPHSIPRQTHQPPRIEHKRIYYSWNNRPTPLAPHATHQSHNPIRVHIKRLSVCRITLRTDQPTAGRYQSLSLTRHARRVSHACLPPVLVDFRNRFGQVSHVKEAVDWSSAYLRACPWCVPHVLAGFRSRDVLFVD